MRRTGRVISTIGSCIANPEIIAIANGRCMAAPWPMPKAKGRRAKAAAKLVMATGLSVGFNGKLSYDL